MKYQPDLERGAAKKDRYAGKQVRLKIIAGEGGKAPRYPAHVSDESLEKLLGRMGAPARLNDRWQTKEAVGNDRISELEATINILLEKLQKQEAASGEKVMANIQITVLPYLEKIRKTRLDANQKDMVDILESNINEIMESFALKLSSKHIALTYTEIMVANLVKLGYTTKDIAGKLGLACKTIESHRANIRRKLGIKKKMISLRSYLVAGY